MTIRIFGLVGCLLVVLQGIAAAAERSAALRASIDDSCASNVILLIGDGMGDSEITAARNYHVGAAGRLAMDSLPFTGTYTTYAVSEADPSHPDYVTDSAASATGWATGHKTSNRRLSTSAGTDLPLPTLLERAREHGLRTGSVTTSELTDATPAALVAHINDRSCQGPADMARCPQYDKAMGGAGSIAEQTIAQGVDVLLGGGRQRFAQVVSGGPQVGKTVLAAAQERGYRVVTNANELATVNGTPLLGLFADGDLGLEWAGEPARAHPGSGPQQCTEEQRPAEQPSLAEMTRKAIALLLAPSEGAGFFLQVEGASIDKSAHAAKPCGQIGETVAFDAAIAVALEFAREQGDTLVIVAADHAHTCQIVSQGVLTATDHPAGMYSTLLTREGVPMTLAYATNTHGRWQGHTGAQVRLAAYGPRAANVVGLTDQTELFETITQALGLGEDADCGFWDGVGRFLSHLVGF